MPVFDDSPKQPALKSARKSLCKEIDCKSHKRCFAIARRDNIEQTADSYKFKLQANLGKGVSNLDSKDACKDPHVPISSNGFKLELSVLPPADKPEDAALDEASEVAVSATGSSRDLEDSSTTSPQKPPFQRAPGPALKDSLEQSAATPITEAVAPDPKMNSTQTLFALPDVCSDCRSHFMGLQAQAVT